MGFFQDLKRCCMAAPPVFLIVSSNHVPSSAERIVKTAYVFLSQGPRGRVTGLPLGGGSEEYLRYFGGVSVCKSKLLDPHAPDVVAVWEHFPPPVSFLGIPQKSFGEGSSVYPQFLSAPFEGGENQFAERWDVISDGFKRSLVMGFCDQRVEARELPRGRGQVSCVCVAQPLYCIKEV